MAQPWKSVPLVAGAYSDDCKPWAQQDLCGWIPVNAEQAGARSNVIARQLPGLQEFATFPDCPRQRGAHDMEGCLFVVFDTTLGEVLPSGAIAVRGTISGRGRVSMTHNGVNEMLIVNGDTGYIYNRSTETLTQITDDGFPGAFLADYIGHTFVAIEPLGRYFFNSALDDGLAYNALETYQGETKPDRFVSGIVAGGEYVALSQRSIEHFAYTGETNAIFQNKQISIDRGCAAAHAVSLLDGAVLFIGEDGSGYEKRGYNLTRITTHAIEQAWSKCNLSRAFSYVWEDKGHKVWYVTFPDGYTWGFDMATRLWHRKQSEGMDRCRLAWCVKWQGHWYGGEYNSGRVFRLDWAYHLEGSAKLMRSCTTGVMHADQRRIRFDALEVVVDASGEATVATTASTTIIPHVGLAVTGTLPTGWVGAAYAVTLGGTGGTSPYTFAATGLPAGLSMSSGGAVTGTITNGLGDSVVAVTMTDALGAVATASLTLAAGLYPQLAGWKYLDTTLADATNYSASAFDDSAWSSGAAPIGNLGPYGSIVNAPIYDARFNANIARTVGFDARTWLRRHVTVNALHAAGFTLKGYVDNGFTVYVNGVQRATYYIATQGGYSVTVPGSAFVVGDNVIAVNFVDDATHTPAVDAAYFDFLLDPL